MLKPIAPDRVLAAVLIDARLQKEMRSELGAKADVYLEACYSLATDSIVDEVIDYVEESVLNCTRTIARYNAKNYGNSFHINIYGFDALCCVFAPEFGRSSLFLSHEDAMEYVEKEFMEFGIGKVRVYVGRPSRFKVQTPAVSCPAKSDPSVLRHRIGGTYYSKSSDGSYIRYRNRLLDSDSKFDANQLVAELSSSHVNTDVLLNELRAAGWHDIEVLTASAIRDKTIDRQKLDEIQREALAHEVVFFIDKFLAGRNDLDGSLVEIAARNWAWGERPTGLPDDEEAIPHMGAIRERYYLALHLYTQAKAST